MTDDDRALADPYDVDEVARGPSPTATLSARERVDRDAALDVRGAIGGDDEGVPVVEVTVTFDGGTFRLTLAPDEVRHLRSELDGALTDAELLVEEDRDVY